MNVEFNVHGTLSAGQSAWKGIDKDYIGTLYQPSKEDFSLMVEVVKRQAQIKTFYNFLVRNKVLSKSNREGAYFGMTLSIDDLYCLDAKGLYSLFDTVFSKMIVGNILKLIDDSRYIYMIDGFEEKNTFLKTVEQNFSVMFSSFFRQQDFIRLSSDQVSVSKVIGMNPLDVNPQNIKDAFCNNARVMISPAFPSIQMKLYMMRAEEERQKSEAELKRAFMAKLDQQKEELEAELQSKDMEMAEREMSLNGRISELEKQLQSHAPKAGPSVKSPTIINVSGRSVGKLPVLNGEHTKWLLLALLVGLAVVIFLCLRRPSADSGELFPENQSGLAGESERTQEGLADVQRSAYDETLLSKLNPEDYSIDIDGYYTNDKGEKIPASHGIAFGQTYTLAVSNQDDDGKPLPDGIRGVWQVVFDDASVITLHENILYVPNNEKKTAKIVYYVSENFRITKNVRFIN